MTRVVRGQLALGLCVLLLSGAPFANLVLAGLGRRSINHLVSARDFVWLKVNPMISCRSSFLGLRFAHELAWAGVDLCMWVACLLSCIRLFDWHHGSWVGVGLGEWVACRMIRIRCYSSP